MSRSLRGGSPKSRGHDIYHVRQSNQRFRRELQTNENVKGVQWPWIVILIIILIIIGSAL
ncbi:hypothetical protein JIPhKp127_0016 [Klebsiella phage JIPh_Kp127]|uniref:Uncharacterized protein n=1 Tax=Klebsiella phage JIPh_Kp127 TaxID=2653645 RepID=A0A5P8PL23_9CAUD|nr:hypothetical protein JIPhKp127_0016 [Klebsiella phage JIPh_Kp127]